MATKSIILRKVDSFLFANFTRTLTKVYYQAIKLNNVTPFNYEFFTTGLLKVNSDFPPILSAIPNQATIEYLTPLIEQYSPMIERRERIQHYLLQFMNQSEQDLDVLYLLPPLTLASIITVSSYDSTSGELIPTTSNLVRVFKQKPEYDMLKQQEVFLKMGL